MLDYLKRLVTTGAAYQFGDILAKGLAVLTLPLYTRTSSSGRLRRGRNAADGGDPVEHPAARRAWARRSSASTSTTTTPSGASGSRAPPRPRSRGRRRWPRWSRSSSPAQLSRLILGFHDPLLIDCAIVGLWAFTNLEMAYAQLRVDERARAYIYASGANVAMTVTLHGRAGRVRGPGRARSAARQLRRLGAGRARPVVAAARALLAAREHRRPARDAALRAADGARRRKRVRATGRRPLLPVPQLLAERRRASTRSRCKLATVVFVAVRGFQYAWPPLAYSIESDEEAADFIRS